MFWQKIAQSQPKCDVFRQDLRRFFSPWGQPVPWGSLVACHLSEGPKGFVQCSSEGFMKDCCWVSVVNNHKTEWICELRGRDLVRRLFNTLWSVFFGLRTAVLVVCLVNLSPVVFLSCHLIIMTSCHWSDLCANRFDTHHRTCAGGGASDVWADRPVCGEAGEHHGNKRCGKKIRI